MMDSLRFQLGVYVQPLQKAFQSSAWVCRNCLFIWPKVIVYDLPLMTCYAHQIACVGSAFNQKTQAIHLLFKKIYDHSGILSTHSHRLQKILSHLDESLLAQSHDELSAFLASEQAKIVKIMNCFKDLIPKEPSIQQAGLVMNELAQTASLLERLIDNLSRRDGLFSRPRSSSDLTSATPTGSGFHPVREEDEAEDEQGSEQEVPIAQLHLTLPPPAPRVTQAGSIQTSHSSLRTRARDQAFIDKITVLSQIKLVKTYQERMALFFHFVISLLKGFFYDLPHFIVLTQKTLQKLLVQAPDLAQMLDDLYLGMSDFDHLLEAFIKLEAHSLILEKVLAESTFVSYRDIQAVLDQLVGAIDSQLPMQVRTLSSQFNAVLAKAAPLLEKALMTLGDRSIASVAGGSMFRFGSSSIATPSPLGTPTGPSETGLLSSAQSGRRGSVAVSSGGGSDSRARQTLSSVLKTAGQGLAGLFTPPSNP